MEIYRRSLLLSPLMALTAAGEQRNGGQGTYARHYGLTDNTTLQEQGSSDTPNNEKLWVNSGGYLFVKDRIGRTNFGELPEDDRWRKLYADGSRNPNNPIDTDEGFHPQNLFRMITRTKWNMFVQQAYFRVSKLNMSDSSNRNQSNGFLFFNRYMDNNNLYYAGIRVDGRVVIKKKISGRYEPALDERVVYSGKYDRTTNPNLIPLNRWIGLRSVIQTINEAAVSIKVYWDEDAADNWKLVAEAIDENVGGLPFLSAGFAGIRTDFMDIEFCRYSLRELSEGNRRKDG